MKWWPKTTFPDSPVESNLGIPSLDGPRLARETSALIKKCLILFNRSLFWTFIRALVVPIIFIWFMSCAQFLFQPAATYGIGSIYDLPPIRDQIGDLIFAYYASDGVLEPEMDRIMDLALDGVPESKIYRLQDPNEIYTVCKQSIRGLSNCYGAIEWVSADPQQGVYNYTVRIDSGTTKLDISSADSNVQYYIMPIQNAVDLAITNVSNNVEVVPYTTIDQAAREAQVRKNYLKTLRRILACAFIIGMIGVTYHIAGVVSSEREDGISALVEAMGCSKLSRLLSYFISFSLIYFPSWIVMGILENRYLFPHTNAALHIFYNLLSGFSIVSMSIFATVPLSKSLISGLVVSGVNIFLAIMAQVYHSGTYKSPGIYVLSFLFPAMNNVFYLMVSSEWEDIPLAQSLIKKSPESGTYLGVLWIAAVFQIFAYFFAAYWLEKRLYGVTKNKQTGTPPGCALVLNGLEKTYYPKSGIRRKGLPPVKAVHNLSLSVPSGGIFCLLGANGSGKTTTLSIISGLLGQTDGQVIVENNSSIGICPQQNILWDNLTVEEHIRLWCRLKGCNRKDLSSETKFLAEHCDIDVKLKTKTKNLSGGQKRKLQLAIMLAGGSNICCVDEASSGMDPLSRRKIWDILMAQRSKRTILLTTHFLDEADVLADDIAIMHRGELKVQGSSAQLKEELGDGYRIHIQDGSHGSLIHSSTSRQVANILQDLDSRNVQYKVDGPELEGVFLRIVEAEGNADNEKTAPLQVMTSTISSVTEMQDTSIPPKVNDDEKVASSSKCEKGSPHVEYYDTTSGSPSYSDKENTMTMEKEVSSWNLQLEKGQETNIFQQTLVMIYKYLLILRRSPIIISITIIVPIIVCGVCLRFLSGFSGSGCGPTGNISDQDYEDTRFSSATRPFGGSQAYLSNHETGVGNFLYAMYSMNNSILPEGIDNITQAVPSFLSQWVYFDSADDMLAGIRSNATLAQWGGLFINDDGSSRIATRLDMNIGQYNGLLLLNMRSNMVSNSLQIITSVSTFQIPWTQETGDTLQFVVYFGLAMGVFPAFFGLYPTYERLQKVRNLHYSNGLRILPLWLGYGLINFIFVLVISVICTGIISGASTHFVGVGYLFVIFMLYGIASIYLAFCLSLLVKSQVAAFAVIACVLEVYFLAYFIAIMASIAYVDPRNLDSSLNIIRYVMGIFMPSAPLLQSLFLMVNLFGMACDADQLISYPGDIRVYGAPILYLVFQVALYGTILVWHESGKYRIRWGRIITWKSNRRRRESDQEKDIAEVVNPVGEDVLREAEMVDEIVANKSEAPEVGLLVDHVSKRFGDYDAVDNVSFRVDRNECFALLGPNGAGKTTTFKMITGDESPSSGDVLVSGNSIVAHRPTARRCLGVCPQFDAVDQLTVDETLGFYARLKGIPKGNVGKNINIVIEAVGLKEFRARMCKALSGGNKRKLSLAIAILGDPDVILLDEPSSGMDAFSKRIMWRTLHSISANRSIVITTHSMEEADALASRAGILAKRMLAIGTASEMRERIGHVYHLKIVLESAPTTGDDEIERVVDWLESVLPQSKIEEEPCLGQIRLQVSCYEGQERVITVGQIFNIIESGKSQVGIRYYSVSGTSLEQVFLSIVGANNVREEGYHHVQ